MESDVLGTGLGCVFRIVISIECIRKVVGIEIKVPQTIRS
jgi:hypothetical protein